VLTGSAVLIKNPADFIGNVIGQSEKNTKGILASAMGKVLIIDEAYMLAGNKQQGADVFKTAIIDTIVAEVQSTPGEDRCVLLLGYKDQMEDMFRDTNPGLARRFPLDSAFVFEDFSDGELRQILDLKLKDVGYDATDQAKQVAIEMLQRARNRPNFGNAGEVDILLDKAKAQHQKHLSSGISKHRDTFEALDFDPDFDRSQRAATNVPALFRDTIGCEDVVKQLQRYQNTAANMKSIGMDPREQIPFNFLFKGPPGTGKTTTAQKMGKVFYDMGFLASAQVEECSATDMIGKYIGHTGPKVQKLLEKALGKVLFIDEAYRLAEPHGFATEAMDELVDCLTKPKYKQKMIVILAGYDEDMNRLMSMNPGLTSRFPDSIFFKPLNAEACLKLLTMLLINRREKKKAPLDLSVLEPPSADFKSRILDQFHKLSKLKSWGNARDVNTIAKSIFGELMASTAAQGANLVVTEKLINDVMDEMFSERSRRGEAAGTSRFASGRRKLPMPPLQQGNAPDVPKSDTATTSDQPPPKEGTKQQEPPPQTPQPTEKQPPSSSSQSAPTTPRDAGVSDATWNQLELDKQVALALEQQHQAILDSNKQTIASLTLLALEEDVATKEDEERRAAENAINTDLQELISKEEEERLNNLKSLAEQAQNKEDLARLEREQAEKQAANKALERKKLEQLRALHDQQTLAAEDKRRREQDRIEQERLRREREAQVADMQKEREKERKAQSKLREMGVCVMGYRWIKQSGGYRCAGGSHYVSDAALGV
jgi:DNA polymerase III delta prime subunit